MVGNPFSYTGQFLYMVRRGPQALVRGKAAAQHKLLLLPVVASGFQGRRINFVSGFVVGVISVFVALLLSAESHVIGPQPQH